MIKLTLFSFVLSFVAFNIMATDVVTKKVSTSASTIKWVGKKVTGQHNGTIGLKSGQLQFDGNILKGGEFTIDMNTLTVNDLAPGKGKEKLEGHLSSADFFGITAHPTAHFKFTSATTKGGQNYDVKGDLTIKGITHPVSFTTKVNGDVATADIIVDRTLYDIRYGSTKFGALADKAIYDNFTLSISLSYGDIKVKQINAANSTINWTGKKVGGQHRGTIGVKSGTLQYANGAPIGGEFVIDMASLSVKDLKPGKGKEKLEGHLTSDDFFGIADHPTATLTINNVMGKGGNNYQFSGELTIKGITQPITFAAVVDGKAAIADIAVDRTLYNVKYGSTKFGTLADKAIYDDFALKVKLAL
ncbi:MAG: YceI family protein [Saprospiraceae bacterium]